MEDDEPKRTEPQHLPDAERGEKLRDRAPPTGEGEEAPNPSHNAEPIERNQDDATPPAETPGVALPDQGQNGQPEVQETEGNDEPQACTEIPRSLLCDKHIRMYVDHAGLIDKADFQEKDLKAASYGLRLRGPYLVYEPETNSFSRRVLDKGGTLQLKKNSIAFVSVWPVVRIPRYLAARFNLRIDYVYKGLLLGTGPIVDPNFDQQLSFPLHNLTNNEYQLPYNDRIIWMEFTKLSGEPKDVRDYESADVRWYVDKALEGTGADSVASSLPTTLQDLTRRASEAEKQATQAAEDAKVANRAAKKMARYISIAVAVGILSTLVGLGMFIWNAQTTVMQVDRSHDQFRVELDKLKRLQENSSRPTPDDGLSNPESNAPSD